MVKIHYFSQLLTWSIVIRVTSFYFSKKKRVPSFSFGPIIVKKNVFRLTKTLKGSPR